MSLKDGGDLDNVRLCDKPSGLTGMKGAVALPNSPARTAARDNINGF
jgi:hypothetical protein